MDLQLVSIAHFEIGGLHGDRNLWMDFNDPVKILVSENGSGKTTILSTMFYLLSGNWFKLAQRDFTYISVIFTNGEEVRVERNEIIPDIDGTYPSLAAEIRSRLSSMDYDRLRINAGRISLDEYTRRYSSTIEQLRIPVQVVYDDLLALRNRNDPKRSAASLALLEQLDEKSKKIKDIFPYDILYFPTYRRVEEESTNLGYVAKDSVGDQQLLQFGMQDVQTRFDRITSDIRSSSVEWYSKINGKMLTQLINGIQDDSIESDRLTSPETLRIVLDRIGDNITKEDKEHILHLVNTDDIREQLYRPLAYFLSNLVQVYDQQRDKDNAIKSFAKTVNDYIGNSKEVRYNESRVDIQIVNKPSMKDVSLEKLSSGEKQVVSLFSKLYLDGSKPYVILFDEPELSLSIEWQRKLLPDIVQSGKCAFLLAATHSPFIFENDLDRYASLVNFKSTDLILH